MADYQKICKGIKSLHKKMQAHLELTRKQMASAAALAVELSYFHHETAAADRTVAFGQLHAELERIQLNSVEKLYHSEVKSKTEVILLQYPEVISHWKERKKHKAAFALQQKKYEEKQTQLKEFGDPGHAPSKKGLFGKKKTESEIAEELNARAQKLHTAQQNLSESTEWLNDYLAKFLASKSSGDLLDAPLSAIVACQDHLMKEGTRRMEKVKCLFPACEKYELTLQVYDEESIQEIRAREIADGKGAVFGRKIKSKTPSIICDCIAYIRNDSNMDIEGIFRIPGENNLVEKIKNEYDKGKKGALGVFVDDIQVHDVCGLFKLWFRCTKDPLLPYAQYEEFLTTMRQSMMNTDGQTTVEKIVSIANSIESPRKELLGLLMNFMFEITEHQKFNNMTAANLATCIAPSIARSRDSAPTAMLRDLHPLISTVTILIENAKLLDRPLESEISKSTHVKLKERQAPVAPPRNDSVPQTETPGGSTPPPGLGFEEIDLDL